MLYQAYQKYCDIMAPPRALAYTAMDIRDRILDGARDLPYARRGFALADVFASATITHRRPPFGIHSVLSGSDVVPVREEVTLSLPFGDMLHFAKPGGGAPQPRVLVVTPLSGHFSTLLANTIATLLRDHDVYVTDWRNARDVPISAGTFGLEYTDYVIRFLRDLGPGSHVVAVCQPCVPVLAAVAVMAEAHDPCQPRSMSLLGGPVDARESPTEVNMLATAQSLAWFQNMLIYRVPMRHAGAGRRVYPGFVQLMAFMSMNLGRHCEQFRRFYQHLANAEVDEAEKIRSFYDEYLAVLDLPAEFYLETIDKVFQRTLLAKGELTHRGRRVNPGAIRHTALLTIEGERDDICAVGQTAAAHRLCSSLRPHLKRHHLQPNVGHYGLFSGSRWEQQVYPQVRNMILATN